MLCSIRLHVYISLLIRMQMCGNIFFMLWECVCHTKKHMHSGYMRNIFTLSVFTAPVICSHKERETQQLFMLFCQRLWQRKWEAERNSFITLTANMFRLIKHSNAAAFWCCVNMWNIHVLCRFVEPKTELPVSISKLSW